jgi:hypothetical protein
MGTNRQAGMFESLAHRTSDDLIACSVSGQAEIAVAIESLADEVARLARRINCIVPTANTRRNSPLEKVQFEAALRSAFAGTSCEARPPETDEAKMIPLSPQQDTEINEVIARELVEEANANFKNSLPEPTYTSGREENAVAARVADLYERLSGFIKSSLPKASEHNT